MSLSVISPDWYWGPHSIRSRAAVLGSEHCTSPAGLGCWGPARQGQTGSWRGPSRGGRAGSEVVDHLQDSPATLAGRSRRVPGTCWQPRWIYINSDLWCFFCHGNFLVIMLSPAPPDWLNTTRPAKSEYDGFSLRFHVKNWMRSRAVILVWLLLAWWGSAALCPGISAYSGCPGMEKMSSKERWLRLIVTWDTGTVMLAVTLYQDRAHAGTEVVETDLADINYTWCWRDKACHWHHHLRWLSHITASLAQNLHSIELEAKCFEFCNQKRTWDWDTVRWETCLRPSVSSHGWIWNMISWTLLNPPITPSIIFSSLINSLEQ